MKRASALQALSREHHGALSLALRIIRANGAMDDAAVAHFAQRFVVELEPHFRAEEKFLLPALVSVGEADLVARTQREHQELRLLAVAISTVEDRARPALAFAHLLKAHVRFEEQSLFPTAESRLSADTMACINRHLDPDFDPDPTSPPPTTPL